MDYTHSDEDKQASQNMSANDKAKAMAREMVGDGQSPNLWFVTHGPYVSVPVNMHAPNAEDNDFEIIDGFDADKDTFTQGPFTSYEEALECYDEIELDAYYGIGQAFIEDRECGVVTEKWLYKRVRTEYVQDEYDNSKRFYKNN